MATTTSTGIARVTNVAIHPATDEAELYRSARVAGFPASPSLNLRRYPGKTIEHLTFTHVYLGGAAAWHPDDVQQIDWALPAAMRDSHLNNVLAQYFPDGEPTAAFAPSRTLEGPLPNRVYRDTAEGIVARLDLARFELESTVFCLLLPPGVVLVDGTSTGNNGVETRPRRLPRLGPREAKDDLLRSRRLLGGHERHQRLPRGLEKHVRGLLPRALRGANGSRRRGRDPRRQLAARRRLSRLVLATGRRDRRHPARGGGREPDVGDEGGQARERRQDGARPVDVVERSGRTGGADRPQARVDIHMVSLAEVPSVCA
jgi:hypothetical protein